MKRDWARTPELMPSDRMMFLEELALHITANYLRGVDEEAFRNVVVRMFPRRIRYKAAEGVSDPGGLLSDDLRSSTTLTRVGEDGHSRWQFSHNSLREFLLVKRIVNGFIKDKPVVGHIPISETMTLFARSIPKDELALLLEKVAMLWPTRRPLSGLDLIVSLLWPALVSLYSGDSRSAFVRISGPGLDIDNVRLSGLRFGADSDLSQIRAEGAELSSCVMDEIDLSCARFADSVLDGVSLRGANLRNSDFRGAFIVDCDLTEATLDGADFTQLDDDSNAFIRDRAESRYLDGALLKGYLRARGARTDEIDPFYVYCWQDHFEITQKIARALADEGLRQRRGVEQRGASSKNTEFARRFVKHLIQKEIVATAQGNQLLAATQSGRIILLQYVDQNRMDDTIESFWVKELL
jgi:hypothetical protein